MAQRFSALFLLAVLTAAPWSASAASDPVVATFGDQKILCSEVEALHAAQFPQVALDQIFDQLVDTLINDRLLGETATKAGLRDDPEVKAYVRQKELEFMMMVYLQRKADKVVTDKAMKDSYAAYVADLPPMEEAHVHHIEAPTEVEARTLITQLKGGADFAALAAKHSKGPSAAKGGDLGFLTKDRIPPELVEAVFGLKDGAVTSEPVTMGGAWHVFKVTERRPATPPTFEQVQGLIARQLQAKAMEDEMIALRKKIKVVRFTKDGAPVK